MMLAAQVPIFRAAGATDCAAIADLHSRSWRLNYRGCFSDAYLDGPVVAERRRVWTSRLAHPADGQIVIVAEQAGALVGFICSFADRDRILGSLIDNLHVATNHKGRGVGRGLMREVAHHLLDAMPRRPIYLDVLEANEAARGFYDRLGGDAVERASVTEPDGSICTIVRYVWPSPARLLALAAGPRASRLPGGPRPCVEQPDQRQCDQDRDDDPHEQRA